MWLLPAMWLGLCTLLAGPADRAGPPLQDLSRSRRPRESRQRSGLFPRLTRHRLGLLASAGPCLSEAASSSLSMLRLNSCSFSDDAFVELYETFNSNGPPELDTFVDRLQFKASQQTSEARQDPARPQPGRAACLRAGLPPGAPGPGTVRRHQENNYADGGESSEGGTLLWFLRCTAGRSVLVIRDQSLARCRRSIAEGLAVCEFLLHSVQVASQPPLCCMSVCLQAPPRWGKKREVFSALNERQINVNSLWAQPQEGITSLFGHRAFMLEIRVLKIRSCSSCHRLHALVRPSLSTTSKSWSSEKISVSGGRICRSE
ncbi:hypothetical protein EYF80_010432 [Liparis tanakae]|uniref:Uncharacterized protein n=1 Tax=Liparis tanakae TaxID=230148 RepID=A0A4Z2IP21_9TELE|nr:hypothetical protein EYF80_010432 [Liparis tanakae]